MKRNFVLPDLKLRQMNMAGICTAAIFQIFVCHKGAGSLLTNSARGITQQCSGQKPITNTVTRKRFKGRVIPKSRAFSASGSHGRTGSRGEVSRVRLSTADEVSQTHLLCHRSHAFYGTLPVPQRRAKITWKKTPLIVLGARAHNDDPADLIDPRSDAGGKRTRWKRVLLNSTCLKKSHIKILLK